MPAGPLDYEVVDVFTDRTFAGNPLAVVHGSEELSYEQLLALAREFNLSETTFPQPLSVADVEAGADYRVRIFTPAGELPFAGHPTLGTAWVLHRRGTIESGSRVQSCGAGLIGVDVPTDSRDRVSLTAVPRDVARHLTPDQTQAVASLVGVRRDDVMGAAYTAGCGLTWLYLRVAPHAVPQARPSTHRVDELQLSQDSLMDPLDGICVYAVSAADGDTTCALNSPDTELEPGKERQPGAELEPGRELEPGAEREPGRERQPGTLLINARVFVPGLGIPEDPATGSAAAGLGLVLVASGAAAPDGITSYRITQGLEMGRPSLLYGGVEAADGVALRCQVAGQVVAVASGTIAIPPRSSPDQD